MNIVEILDFKLQEKYMKGNVSFIVMNKDTAKSIVSGLFDIETMPLLKYRGHEVLISESLQDNEFKIG